MKRLTIALAAVTFLLSEIPTGAVIGIDVSETEDLRSSPGGGDQEPPHRSGEILIKIRVEDPNEVEAIQSLRKKYPQLTIERLFRSRGPKRAKQEKAQIGLDRMYKIQLPPGADLSREIGALNQDPNLEYAEPNYLMRTQTPR